MHFYFQLTLFNFINFNFQISFIILGAESRKIDDVMDAAKNALKIFIDETSDGEL